MRLPFAGLAPLRPWAVLYFEPSRWRALQEAVATQLRCPAVDLGRLHEIEASRGTAPRKSRRRTTGRRRDVEALEELVLSYRAFICEVVAPHVAATFDGPCDELVFQANPSLRVVVPGDRPSGRRHCDADYGHQPGQVNFWLPLALAHGPNTLWVEGLGDAPLVIGGARPQLQEDDGARGHDPGLDPPSDRQSEVGAPAPAPRAGAAAARPLEGSFGAP